MVEIRVEAATPASLEEYAQVPIAFWARSRLDLRTLLHGELYEISVEPWLKDYDAIERPTDWAARFDMSQWALLTAWDGERRVGGAVLAFDTPGVDMLEGRRDLMVLWDIRVAPGYRSRGVGRALFEAAAGLARDRGCTELKVETQDINVPACRFYARQGCVVSEVDPGAYMGLDEAQVIWRRSLADLS